MKNNEAISSFNTSIPCNKRRSTFSRLFNKNEKIFLWQLTSKYHYFHGEDYWAFDMTVDTFAMFPRVCFDEMAAFFSHSTSTRSPYMKIFLRRDELNFFFFVSFINYWQFANIFVDLAEIKYSRGRLKTSNWAPERFFFEQLCSNLSNTVEMHDLWYKSIWTLP